MPYTNGKDTEPNILAVRQRYPNTGIAAGFPQNWPDGPWRWEDPAPVQLTALTDYKANAQHQLVYIFNQLADDIAGLYPWFERDTWKDQEYEALTYQSWFNNSSNGTAPSTPTLTGISAARGIPLPELATRVIANATTWRQVAPQLAGQRQAYFDQIEAAEDRVAVDQVLEFARAATVSQAV